MDESVRSEIRSNKIRINKDAAAASSSTSSLAATTMALMLSYAASPIAVSMATGRPSRTMGNPWRSQSRSRSRGMTVVAMADILGDFGARDPFPEEIESNFGEKTLGNVDTLHRILIPTLSVLSLARLPLDATPPASPLSHDDARKLLHKVVGWRLIGAEEEGVMKLQCVWKVRDQACGEELIARINRELDGAGHAPTTLLLEAPNQVKAELHTPSISGLSVNDFIVAARIDQIKTQDLLPKKRVWAC